MTVQRYARLVEQDDIVASTKRLTELEIQALIRTYEEQAANTSVSAGFRSWYASLAAGLHEAHVRRGLSWIDLASDLSRGMRLPGTWQECVDLLPPLPADQGGGEPS